MFHGTANIEIMQNAINDLVCKNDALRLHIVNARNPSEVYQVLGEYQEGIWPVLYFDSIHAFREKANVIANEFMPLSCDLMKAYIIVLPNQYGVLMKTHHIIGDAWTFALMASQVARFIVGSETETASYLDFIESENKYIESSRYASDEAYWKSVYTSHGDPTFLNEDVCVSGIQRVVFTLDKETVNLIKQFSVANKASLFSVLMMVFAIYFNRIKNNCEKFYIGTTILNRFGKEKRAMGMYANAIPVPIALNNSETFEDNLSRLNRVIFSTIRHQKYNYGDVLKNITHDVKLYDVILNYQNAQIDSEITFETEWFPCGVQSESLQIHIDDRDNTDELVVTYDYQTKKFDEKDISRMHGHVLNILFDAISGQDSTCRSEGE